MFLRFSLIQAFKAQFFLTQLAKTQKLTSFRKQPGQGSAGQFGYEPKKRPASIPDRSVAADLDGLRG